MSAMIALLIAVPPTLLSALVLLPDARCNAHVRTVRTTVTFLTGVQFWIAACLAIAVVTSLIAKVHFTFLPATSDLPITLAILYDGVASLMLALVSFIGWVVCQYSLRYLDGESTQGRYFRWLGFTIGSVSLMVISGNLLVFFVAWVMTSLGLHQLLLHYSHRPAAQRAAWTKFTISRLGDAALIVAIVIIYDQFKTLDFVELFALSDSLTSTSAATQVASFLLVFGAVTKSAQFPFHTWLPQTMETPTPVSAMMHAGIVNAGGYLMIRTSPFIAMTPWAMTTLAIIGALTAFFAAIVMLTQTSIKKSLAYSTIAQMGFMLLQCGLGAFSAAMLHIIAHSLYKAHAFLSSGNVIAERTATRSAPSAIDEFSWAKFTSALAMSFAFLGLAFVATGIDPWTKPGSLLLGSVLCVAMAHWTAQSMRTGSRRLAVQAVMVVGALCLVYSISFALIDKTLAASLPSSTAIAMPWLVFGLASAGFAVLLLLQVALASRHRPAFLDKFYIHAANGFYIESLLRRAFGPLLNT